MDGFLVQKAAAKEKMLEAMFEYAGACHVENIINEMEDENKFPEEIPFPPELDERINKLIGNYKCKSRNEKVWRGASAVFAKVVRLFN
ncbi:MULTISPECIES: hypothetical protein [Thermotaleaceae]|uniref:Uncharacterized protein n=1 Tax=Geosporobacter subterraneus DSM 17957 TaxID=1121919 RepID=A0A1M6PZR0_9FIRM|nr:hypothetical protein [Geosporobacter subterraneus]SHK13428.1 hypothetical protein SAMN02745975_03724 [Geosporobacter subterraneus DSM 17957]